VKVLQGQPVNLAYPIIGRVSRNGGWLCLRKDTIYVSEQIRGNLCGYTGIVVEQSANEVRFKSGKPSVFGLSSADLVFLQEGDVILLEPSGLVTVVWDADSPHNSIFVTDTCNCKCIICPQPGRDDQKDYLPFNLRILKLVKARSVSHIGITGGEPTLKPEGLRTILKFCRERFPSATISLLTNGKRFEDLEFTRSIAEIDHPGLVYCVSLYSDTDTEHDRIVGIPGSFRQTVKGLHNLALFRQPVEIRIVIFRNNYQRLPSMAEFIFRNFPFVVHVAFMGMECTGLASANLDQVWIDPNEYALDLKTAVLHLNRRGIPVSIYNLPLCLIPHEVWRFSKSSISTWKNIYLEQCKDCRMRANCGGFFSTSVKQSNRITPIKNEGG
jgi:His-Xaa-Ser system radical SAM maturase HxsC